MTKGLVAGVILSSSLLWAEGLVSKSLQQKPQMKESGFVQQKSIKIKYERNKNKSYPRATIATH